jgi:hypothetical protein
MKLAPPIWPVAASIAAKLANPGPVSWTRSAPGAKTPDHIDAGAVFENKNIVTAFAGQHIVTGLAVQNVVAFVAARRVANCVAGQNVVEFVADAERRIAEQAWASSTVAPPALAETIARLTGGDVPVASKPRYDQPPMTISDQPSPVRSPAVPQQTAKTLSGCAMVPTALI